MTVIAAVDRTDGQERVVDEARALAEAFGDELHVVHVLGQSEFVELERTTVENTGQAVDMDRVKAIAAEIAAESAEGSPGEFQSVGLVGDASDEIVRYSREHGARYVVLGGRKRSPVGKALFGSVTQSVLLNADRPVVTVMEGEPESGNA